LNSLERFEQNRRIVERYTSEWLAGIDSDVGRLAHVSMLRDVSSGRYVHPFLEESFSKTAIHEALQYCHEELFQRTLECSLELQEWDLRAYFAGIDASPEDIAARWLEIEFPRTLVPFGAPSYLRDLFLSNTTLILSLIAAEHVSQTTAA